MSDGSDTSFSSPWGLTLWFLISQEMTVGFLFFFLVIFVGLLSSDLSRAFFEAEG